MRVVRQEPFFFFYPVFPRRMIGTMNDASAYQTQYNLLNSAQKAAVDAIEGPVMVVAGPGTGKTQILTLRAGRILQKTDASADSILALTFTENAAANMRSRLARLIGPSAYRVWIGTFHGFCNDLIATYPEYFERILGARAASDVEQISLLQKSIVALDIPLLKPFGEPLFYLRSARSSISHLKREGVSPTNFLRILDVALKEFNEIPDLVHEKGKYAGQMKGAYVQLKKNLDKNFDLQKLYARYQDDMRVAGLYDFDDMILEVATTLQANSDLLLTLQERFAYIMVDEHQDTNNAQNKVLELLASASDSPNIFVVGDEKQAIFRFQGASIENFLYFQKLYPTARCIILSQNYRSTQPLLDAATSVIGKRARSFDSRSGESDALRAAHAPSVPTEHIQLKSFSTAEVEAYAVAKDILTRIARGVPAHEIAILYRDNGDAHVLANALSAQGIAHQIISKGNILHDIRIGQLILLLRVIAEFPAQEYVGRVLHFDFFDISPLDIAKILAYHAREKHLSLIDIITSSVHLGSAQVSEYEKILAIGQLFVSWKRFSHNATVPELFQKILYECGYMTKILADVRSADLVRKTQLLFHEIEVVHIANPSIGVSDVIAHFDILKEYGIALSYTPTISADSGVVLMTAHSAKGLEFDSVFMVGVHDGHWGGRLKRDLIRLPHIVRLDATLPAETDDEDERRLFYVAMTRARKELTLTYSTTSASGKSQLPSQFVNEIHADFIQVIDTNAQEKEYAEAIKIQMNTQITHLSSSKIDPSYLRDLFFVSGLSATAVNNYIECPIKYLYVNLLRLPSVKSRAQLYGTAIHAALKAVFDAYGVSGVLDDEIARIAFETQLGRVGLPPTDFAIFLEKGSRALSGYLAHYGMPTVPFIASEVKVAGVVIPAEDIGGEHSHDVPLSGFLDRVDMLDNIRSRACVVDYKTGKYKTRNELAGSTKNADGNYLRQLTFYKLLLDRSSQSFRMESGRIDFVEPDEKGRYYQHDFVISADMANELYQTIVEISRDIASGEFLKKGCGDKECEYCALFGQL